MRKFNPEKELYKIQHGNKNRILYGIILLLLIISIGSTYALYQVRYNKRIIYTTIAPFTKKDIIISVKLDDQDKSVDTFPGKKEGYFYSHIECENKNIKNASWNDVDWNLTASINGPDKCTVYFVKSPFHMKSCEGKEMSECLLEEGQKFTEYLAFDDPDQNGRYMGANPANYIWFNCDDYNNPSEDTCERWRIIGSFKNISKITDEGSTENQNLIKITRANSIGTYSWDNRDTTTGLLDDMGTGDWTEARLMKLLNPGYNEEEKGGSLYWNADSGECYAGKNNVTKSCDFTKTGLKNEYTKNMIESVIWYLGGTLSSADTPGDSYTHERDKRKDNITYVWPSQEQINQKLIGKIGLIYPSDYAYATSGGEYGRTSCLNIRLYSGWGDYEDSGIKNNMVSPDCRDNTWLLYDNPTGLSYDQKGKSVDWWTITSGNMSGYSSLVPRFVNLHGNVFTGLIPFWYTLYIRPTLYLTHDTKVTGGDGTYSSPYIISVN